MAQIQCPKCKAYDVHSTPNLVYKGAAYIEWKRTIPTSVRILGYVVAFSLLSSIFLVNAQTLIKHNADSILLNAPIIITLHDAYDEWPIKIGLISLAAFFAYGTRMYLYKQRYDSVRSIASIDSTNNACKSCRYSWIDTFIPPKPISASGTAPSKSDPASRPFSIPKFTRDVALPLTSLLISLASLTGGLLGLSHTLNLPDFSRPILSMFGITLIIGASITLDNVIDHLSSDEWNSLLGEEFDVDKGNHFIARIRLFNGGYLIVSIFFGFLGAALLYLGFEKTFSNEPRFLPMLAALFAYIFIQMMTNTLGHGSFSLVAFAGLSGMAWYATFR